MSEMVEIQKESYEDCCVSESDKEHYPWGTKISLEDDLVTQLGLEGVDVGASVTIYADAFVSRKELSDSVEGQGSFKKEICLQITAIKINPQSQQSRAEILYGPESQ